tara:strand:+ start:29 stop:892 length:864 start_codon:yes stop_codon:yes gene_type:complete
MPLWKPNDLSDLKLWLRGKDLETSLADGANITTWADQSGNNHHLVTGTSPNFEAGISNNRGGVNFTSSANEFLVCNDADGPMDVGTGNFYFGVFCASAASTSSVEVGVAHDKTGSKFEIRHNGSKWIPVVGSSVLSSDSNTTDGALHYISAEKRDTNTVAHHRDGGADIATVTSFTTDISDDEFLLGKRDDSDTKPFDGKIIEVICYHTEISTSEKDLISGYVTHQWDKESLLGNGHSTGAAHKYKNGPPTSCHCVSERTLSTNFLSSNPRNPAQLSENLNTYDERR